MNRRQFGKLGAVASISGMVSAVGSARGLAAERSEVGSKPQSNLYSPSLLSLQRHKTPEWYEDAKFGMFIDFGLYSVAGYAPKRKEGAMYPDWYLWTMYHQPEVAEYHKKTWGADFQRDDFIPKFTAEKFDPQELAQIAQEAGMKYVMPFCKHHDGFCLWPSSYTKRNAAEMGPKRDLIGPLRKACRDRDLKFGFYFSIEEWEYPVLVDGKKMTRIWNGAGQPEHDLVPYDADVMDRRVTGKIPRADFFAEYIIPQAKEFIDQYRPDLMWLDGEWRTPIEDSKSPEIVSYLYNRAKDPTQVASNDRLGSNTRFNCGDYYTSEYGSHDNLQGELVHKWEDCRGVSQSFGFNWQDDERSVISIEKLIDTLVEIVSHNGNLLLVVNLNGKGSVPDYFRTRLAEIGRWLKVNGEAIYSTRPWQVASQGDNLRFTRSKDGRYLYAIHAGWPESSISIDELMLDNAAVITMLGSRENLKWRNVHADAGYGKGGKVVIDIPSDLRGRVNGEHAFVFKIQIAD